MAKFEKNFWHYLFYSIHKKEQLGTSDSHNQPVTMASHNNGVWIRMLSVHSHNYGMELLSKLELAQIRDNGDYGKSNTNHVNAK